MADCENRQAHCDTLSQSNLLGGNRMNPTHSRKPHFKNGCLFALAVFSAYCAVTEFPHPLWMFVAALGTLALVSIFLRFGWVVPFTIAGVYIGMIVLDPVMGRVLEIRMWETFFASIVLGAITGFGIGAVADASKSKGTVLFRSILNLVAWIAVLFNGTLLLWMRIRDVLSRYDKSAADVPADKWVWVFASMIFLASAGLILRWGFTIPFILLGAFFVGPFLLPTTYENSTDSGIRLLICAGIGLFIGLVIDLTRDAKHGRAAAILDAERSASVPDWHCFNCGEFVPANFDVCWNCCRPAVG